MAINDAVVICFSSYFFFFSYIRRLYAFICVMKKVLFRPRNQISLNEKETFFKLLGNGKKQSEHKYIHKAFIKALNARIEIDKRE